MIIAKVTEKVSLWDFFDFWFLTIGPPGVIIKVASGGSSILFRCLKRTDKTRIGKKRLTRRDDL